MTADELHALVDDPDKTWREVLHRMIDDVERAAPASELAAVRNDLADLRGRVDALPAPEPLTEVHELLDRVDGRLEALEHWRSAQTAADVAPAPPRTPRSPAPPAAGGPDAAADR